MNAAELIQQLEARGARFCVLGDRLRIQPKSVVTEDLISELRRQKPQVLELLRSGGWPAECLEAERCFGQPHARLFPLLDQTVETPKGRGRLLQVFADRAAVALDSSQDSLTFLLPEEIRPLGVAVCREGRWARWTH